ncbi:hypothetical protein OsI_03784 [Oryza sativa Indica Group]|uniref:Uncharacterized protein n=1 Tax=Oryza sativa subsp. indica TaxID=39946 RepID=B8A9R5_ORYSI|nr:hypothetical protein OsI_03784 [Oryza sativa Indica Group]
MATLRARKRGRGDAGAGAAAVLGALGLGGFAGLDLHRAAPAGEAELEQLAAAYDRASGRISVSIRGAGVSASPADLAVALGLPLGPAALGPEVDASVFLSEEAIAAVRGFLRDRVLLGGGGGGGRELPGEAAVALRLVEEGKAYAVDWCRLFWELLKMDLVSGKPRRYAPHLLRLIEYQRPELFAEVDGSSPLGKRRKSAAFSRQCQWEDEKETDLIDAECGDSRTQAAEAEVERSSQSIGDLEEMPFNCWIGGMIHGVNEGNAELGSQKSLPSEIEVSGCEMGGNAAAGLTAKDQSSDDSSLLSLLRTMDEQDDSSSHQNVISGAKPQPGPNQQSIIEIEDEEDDDDDQVGVGHVPPNIQNGHFGLNNYFVQQRATEGFQNDQTLPSFLACTQQIKACMDDNFLDKMKAIMDARAANQRMINMITQKDYMIAATKRDILEDLGARHVMISQFEHDIELMRLTIQQYRKLFENTSAAYLEYRNRMSREEGDGSSLEVIGIADETEQFVRMQQLDIYQRLNKFQKLWLTKYSDLVGHLTRVAECMTYLSLEGEELGKELLSKTKDAEREGEGDHCSSAVVIDELAQPDQRNDKESMIVNGVSGICNEDEV